MLQGFAAFEEMKSCHEIARHALRVLHKKAGEKKINVRLEGTRAPFDVSSLGKEPQESGGSSGRLFQNMSGAHSDGSLSSASAHAQIPRTQDAVAIGLVWLQDMTPVCSREQMGPSFI